jgi:PAS domain S-box-containing protein
MDVFDPGTLGRALDHLPLPTWVWVPAGEGDFRLAAFNRAALDLGGDVVRAAVGELASALHADEADMLDGLRHCLSEGEACHREFANRSALYASVERVGMLFARPAPGTVVAHLETPVSPREAETQGALSPDEQGAFLRRLLANLPGMAYRCRNDVAWTMEFLSPGCEALTGLAPEALIGNRDRSFGSLIHAEDRDLVWSMVQAGLEARGRFDVAYRLRRPDGSVRWVWEQGAGIGTPDPEDGSFPLIEGFATDITERHELATELRDTEQRYRFLVEQSLAGVYVIERGRFTYVNQRFAEIFGREVAEILALDDTLPLVHPEDRGQVRENLRLRETGETAKVEQVFRGIRKPDDATIHVEAHGSVVQSDEHPIILGVLLDVSDSVRASERYHHAQKMEALGRLAGGIAHDFNNVLSVIRTLAEILRSEQDDHSTGAEDLDEMVRAAERGAALSRQLMTFSKPSASRLERVSLSDAVAELTSMLERIVGDDVCMTIDLAPSLPVVAVDPSHLEQVIMNLVINARDAMPEGGTLTLRTGVADPGRLEPAPAGAVFLSVADTGVGIPEDMRRRIFEPFVTTKGTGGTGLGLGNVWTIADGYGGLVDVDSTIDEGSTFTIVLPVAAPSSDVG